MVVAPASRDRRDRPGWWGVDMSTLLRLAGAVNRCHGPAALPGAGVRLNRMGSGFPPRCGKSSSTVAGVTFAFISARDRGYVNVGTGLGPIRPPVRMALFGVPNKAGL
ncbi:hypothetical protein GCM10009765_57160 [Fodinicola feengrottensis]|uniref:Uncharacterized protein n=1 Tax=Fodinicola feengrottensis TaxID=435914 RepID=A0ABN2I8S2_9ACTN